MFQFPARNSGCSDGLGECDHRAVLYGFNSPLGILVVRTARGSSACAARIWVSIPRSEFWLFGRQVAVSSHALNSGFNSPLGILVVRTYAFARSPRLGRRCFNSPLGILVVRTSSLAAQMPVSLNRFNSPLGILVVRTFDSGNDSRIVTVFQFPARNSGCSDLSFDR